MDGPVDRSITVGIETFGCQMNVYDTAVIFGLLEAAGFRRAERPDLADVLLLNTCSVRDHAEQRVLSHLGEIQQRRRLGGRPRLIGIVGCMAERLGRSLLAHPRGVDLVVGVDQYDRLPVLLQRLLSASPGDAEAVTGHRDDAHYVAPPEAYPTNNSHLVTIHKGCDYRCTYCIVPETRGPQREKSPILILEEVRRIVGAGGVEVTLLGQNVTAYRWGSELDFAGLLSRVASVDGLERIRFLTGHPRDLSESLLRTMAEQPKVCPALHLPIQSGSDRILRRMKRLYSREQYLATVARARELMPDLTLSSDFIVGFPGETEADFHETLEVVRQVAYDQLFSFKYSPRPGVPAARLRDDVSPEAKKQRLSELMAVQEEVWTRLARAQIGQVWRASLEGRARRPASAWKARTANNRKVLVALPAGRPGDMVSVRITGFHSTTFLGELLPNAR
jgi:tRNA-2-methylthio-N6-dimethylallyladenosine synthase